MYLGCLCVSPLVNSSRLECLFVLKTLWQSHTQRITKVGIFSQTALLRGSSTSRIVQLPIFRYAAHEHATPFRWRRGFTKLLQYAPWVCTFHYACMRCSVVKYHIYTEKMRLALTFIHSGLVVLLVYFYTSWQWSTLYCGDFQAPFWAVLYPHYTYIINSYTVNTCDANIIADLRASGFMMLVLWMLYMYLLQSS